MKWGKYVGGADLSSIPPDIQKAFYTPDPEWDWYESGDYVILRQFDEGQEDDRVIAKVVYRRVK